MEPMELAFNNNQLNYMACSGPCWFITLSGYLSHDIKGVVHLDVLTGACL